MSVTIKGNGHAPTVEEKAQEQPNWMATLYPESELGKTLMRAPLLLWRMGLGPALGKALMVITTTGRVSGLPRRVMTEWHSLDDMKIAPCAYGARAQWYKNIMADPHVTIQTAEGVERVRARLVTDDEELLRALEVLRTRNPLMVDAYLEMLGIDPEDDADILAKKERIIWFAFEPTDVPTPPPLPTDLTWVWKVMVVSAVVGGVLSLVLNRLKSK